MSAITSSTLSAEILQRYFGYSHLRFGQRQAFDALMANGDCLVVLPTGAGKSMCYQLAALARRARGDGPTVVISPLIALMDDQVERLKSRGVQAAAWHSQKDSTAGREMVKQLYSKQLDLLYVSPERAALDGFREILKRSDVSLLAIDEAHCISQWGHDFRPEYKRLGELRRILNVPVVALTATATPRVQEEIIADLGMAQAVRIVGDFFRPNLRFSVEAVRTDAERLDRLKAALIAANLQGKKPLGRAIVYCATRKKVELVAKWLKEQGFATMHYHAGRTDLARTRAHRAYEERRTPILVATNAFGMGIDHPDVRLVTHFQTPATLEAYYQEAGRAGRDGASARCLLFYGVSDLVMQRFMIRKQGGSEALLRHREGSLKQIEGYALGIKCRQHILANYFGVGSEREGCGICDNCLGEAPVTIQSVTKATTKRPTVLQTWTALQDTLVVAAVATMRRPAGKALVAKALRGSKARTLKRSGLDSISQNGALKEFSEEQIIEAIEQLLENGKLVRKGKKYPTVWLAAKPVRAPAAAGATTKRRARPPVSELQRELERFCRRTAKQLGWKKTYMVLSKDLMKQIDMEQPQDIYALQNMRGLGPFKIENFGAEILALVRRFGDAQR